MAGESALRGVCPFHRYARAVMAGEKRRRDACPARGNWLLESGRGRITSSAPFLQARRRCHGGRKRVARSLSFSQACALSWWEKNDEGMSARHGEAGESALRRARPFHRHARCHGEGKAPKGCLSDTGKREKARCAGHVLFHSYIAVAMTREKRRRDACPARGSASGKAGEGALRRARPFHRRAAAIVDRRRDERPSFRARRRHIFERPAQTEPAVRALTKPANAKIVRKRRNPRGNFSFLPWLHLQPAVTCVQASLLPWLAGFPSTHSYGDFVNILNGRFKSNRPSFLCAPYPPLTLGLRLVARARPQDGPQPGKCAKPR